MKKYKKPLSEQDIDVLTKLSTMNFSTFNETDIREEFLTPLLKLLGYSKNTDYEVEREESFKLSNMYLQIGNGTKGRIKLDYIFNIRKRNFWIIEAKSGKRTNITEDDIQQAYFYSLHPKVNCRYFIVSNGWITNLYDRHKFLTDDNADIFEPILSIKNSEIKEKFDILYYRIGASSVLFNIKEDCLINEIEKVMSAEVYLDRLKQFEWKVQKTIVKCESKVRENVRNLRNKDGGQTVEDQVFQEYLESLREIDIIEICFNNWISMRRFNIAYIVLKKKILQHYKVVGQSRSSSLAFVFDYLFSPFPTNIPSLRVIRFEYYTNILVLLLHLLKDDDFNDFKIWHNNQEGGIKDILESYILDIFSFFEKNKYLRYLMIIYPLCYKLSKYYIYGLSITDITVSQNIKVREYFLSEEELSQSYHSKGSEYVNYARIITDRFVQDLVKNSFNGNDLKEELFKKTIRDLETSIAQLSAKINLDKLKSEIPQDEQDEMFPIDSNADNPWWVLFLNVIRILDQYNYSIQNQNTKDKILELTICDFISVQCCIQARENWKNFEHLYYKKDHDCLQKYDDFLLYFNKEKVNTALSKNDILFNLKNPK